MQVMQVLTGVLINNCFFVCDSPVGLMNANPIVSQSKMTWGPVLRWQPQKLGARHVCKLLPERCW